LLTRHPAKADTISIVSIGTESVNQLPVAGPSALAPDPHGGHFASVARPLRCKPHNLAEYSV